MSPVQDSAIRPSALADRWYSGEASVLRETIEGYLDKVPPVTLPGRVLALVSPHAGYVYSGAIAAHAYAQVRDARFRRVILLGPLHDARALGSPAGAFMIPAEDAYRTPLGDVPLDRAFIAELGQRVPLTPVRRDKEHALEIELPFLQVVLGSFSLVPIMLGEPLCYPGAQARVTALAAALADLSDDDTLFVASTDLSHLKNYAAVVRTDRRLAELLAAFEVAGLTAALAAEQVQACGETGLIAVLEAARLRGARGAKVLAQTTSGDVTGDRRPGVYTVGYLAAAAYG